MLSQAGQRPAHLTRVRDALTALPEPDQVRLGVLEDSKTGPHLPTCRQTERTFGLVTDALAKDVPDGLPSQALARICDDLLEASIPVSSRTPARRWPSTGPTWKPSPGPRHAAPATAPTPKPGGYRSGGGPGQDSELFFGYYASAGTMMRDEHGPPCRACRYGPGPMTGMGEVEGSDAYHGPDDLLPPESLVTHGTVPTRQLRHKRSCYIMPGTWSLNWGDEPAGLPPWPAARRAG